ncbi:MAG: hypothetical protein PVI33_06715 [Candidatus Omnitrophota bacterium]
MNKKQLVVVWTIAIWISMLFVMHERLSVALKSAIAMVTISSLLIYTLRDKKN